MELKKRIKLCHNGQECEFRTLSIDDVTQSYVDCLLSQKRFIDHNIPNVTIEKQREYVRGILLSDKNTICGLFIEDILIGTSGMQNIGKGCLTAVGMFVLEKEMRGRRYGKTLVWSACKLAKACCDVDDFSGSTKKINILSFKTLTSCGFKTVEEGGASLLLKLNIKDLRKPELVSWYRVEQCPD